MSDDLLALLKKRVVWWESSIRNNREYDVTDCDLDDKLIERLKADANLIQEIEGYLELIAEMDEVDAALDPTHAIRIAGAARRLILSKAKSQQEGETE